MCLCGFKSLLIDIFNLVWWLVMFDDEGSSVFSLPGPTVIAKAWINRPLKVKTLAHFPTLSSLLSSTDLRCIPKQKVEWQLWLTCLNLPLFH
jgi:hypothetical protein